MKSIESHLPWPYKNKDNSTKNMHPVNYKIAYHLNDLSTSDLQQNKILLHLHGSIEKEKEMIVSTQDYISLYTNSRNQKMLSLFFKKQVVVIIGYGMDELEILDFIMRSTTTDNTQFFLFMPIYSYQKIIVSYMERHYQDIGVELIPYEIDKKGYKEIETILKKFGEVLPTTPDIASISYRQGIIDELLEKKVEMSIQDRAKNIIDVIQNHSDLAIYCYSKLKCVELFTHLNDHNAFNIENIPHAINQQGQRKFSIWPPTIYFKYIASLLHDDHECISGTTIKKFLELLVKTLREAKLKKNIHVAYSAIICITKVPMEFIQEKNINLIFEIVESEDMRMTPFDYADTIHQGFWRLLKYTKNDSHSRDIMKIYIKILFSIKAKDLTHNSGDNVDDAIKNDEFKFFFKDRECDYYLGKFQKSSPKKNQKVFLIKIDLY